MENNQYESFLPNGEPHAVKKSRAGKFALVGLVSALGVCAIVAVAVMGLQGSNTPAAASKFSMPDSAESVFDAHFGHKKYSDAERTQRLMIFQENLEKMESLQRLSPDATFGINKFSDMREEEFRAFYTLNQKFGADKCIWPYSGFVSMEGVEAAPSSFDWTKEGAVTPVKNQAQCGSCWAFSTVGALEGLNFMKNNKLESFSEQAIVDCSKECLKSNPQLCNSGCGGGLPWLAYQHTAQKGVALESDYPYTGMDGTCKSYSSEFKNTDWKAHTTDAASIEAYLAHNGPISVTLNATPLMSYTSGILDFEGSQCDPSGMDHAVLLVGYGEENGKKYWKVKNSWDTTWGEKGYFRMTPTSCGLSLCATSPTA